jgi:hypothetical protein
MVAANQLCSRIGFRRKLAASSARSLNRTSGLQGSNPSRSNVVAQASAATILAAPRWVSLSSPVGARPPTSSICAGRSFTLGKCPTRTAAPISPNKGGSARQVHPSKPTFLGRPAHRARTAPLARCIQRVGGRFQDAQNRPPQTRPCFRRGGPHLGDPPQRWAQASPRSSRAHRPPQRVCALGALRAAFASRVASWSALIKWAPISGWGGGVRDRGLGQQRRENSSFLISTQ